MKANGVILYEGPSKLDGQPIVVIATGLARKPSNAKTGDMVQTWILHKRLNPLDASRTGRDTAICGSCPLKGANGKGRTCYVNIAFAPLAIFKAYKSGSYPRVKLTVAAHMVENRAVRLGSYGDPAAVPARIWRSLVSRALSFTGYTHAHRRAGYLRNLVMASVDSEDERREAQRRGWRTFRVRRDSDALNANEIVCPASAEGGRRTTCVKCTLCNGMEPGDPRKSVAIIAHGTLGAVAAFERLAV